MVATDTKAIQKVGAYMRSDMIKARMAEAIGERNAGAYISSVILAVANDESGKLAQCALESIYISAMRAASLRLSVDPSMGQAYMVPFGNRATLIVGYKGLYDMAVRTGRYRYVNTNPIYEGEEIQENRISGLHSLTGNKKSGKVIGWIAAFEMLPVRGQKYGLAKTIYMTVDEIHEHAQKYSPGYKSPKSGWVTNTAEMERKTVLRRLLRKWGYLDPSDAATLAEIESESEPVTVDAEFVEPHPEPKNEAQLMTDLGNGGDPVSNTMWTKWQKLCQNAENANVAYPIDHRETYTNQSIAAAYAQLEATLKANKDAKG
jgi:recombination protein RecT